MARSFQPKVATANDLMEGDVVYLSETGDWTRALGRAAVAMTPEAAEALLARASAHQDRIVGAYLADVALVEGRPEPVHFREVFRTRGPSNYFHGKQASQGQER